MAAQAQEQGADGASPSAPPLYDGLNFVSHMFAGGIAGTVEHIAMYPVDTIKTRMQALSHPGQRLHRMSVREAVVTAVRREGVAGLYKGVGAVAAGAGPAHAMHFAVYEVVKERLGGNEAGHNPMLSGLAGAVATAFNDSIMTPVDVIKQRLQVVHSPYKGVLDCLTQVYQHEGIGALYRSYRTTLVMNVPFIAMHFSVYDAAKRLITGSEDADDDTLAVQLLAGGLAGGSAAAITTPFDVVKTRLQTEGVLSAKRYHSTAVLPIMRRIIAEEGWSALWRGVRPRVVFNAPSAAICWGTYETVKSFLSGGGGAAGVARADDGGRRGGSSQGVSSGSSSTGSQGVSSGGGGSSSSGPGRGGARQEAGSVGGGRGEQGSSKDAG